jgi:hypothetical protein
MLGSLVKVVVALAVVALLAAFATRWVRDKADTALHKAFDTALPEKVEAHAWAPLSHGKPVGTARVRFEDGRLTTVRCHATLGTYSVHIDHGFSFERATTPPRTGCPGRQLRTALAHATHVEVDSQGTVETLAFTDDKDHTVATLRARGN